MPNAQSSVGVVLKSRTIHMGTPQGIPSNLVQLAHSDLQGSCTVGWNSYPSLLIAPLGCNSLSE